jgi:glyoxylase I family protein
MTVFPSWGGVPNAAGSLGWAMPRISGLHHASLPVADAERSGDWYERVFGFVRVLIEEEEDRVTAVMLQHPTGIFLYLFRAGLTGQAPGRGIGQPAVLGFLVSGQPELVAWDQRLTELGIEHSGPRQAHLGWAMDVLDPDGLPIQLHTREEISGDFA